MGTCSHSLLVPGELINPLEDVPVDERLPLGGEGNEGLESLEFRIPATPRSCAAGAPVRIRIVASLVHKLDGSAGGSGGETVTPRSRTSGFIEPTRQTSSIGIDRVARPVRILGCVLLDPVDRVLDSPAEVTPFLPGEVLAAVPDGEKNAIVPDLDYQVIEPDVDRGSSLECEKLTTSHSEPSRLFAAEGIKATTSGCATSGRSTCLRPAQARRA